MNLPRNEAAQLLEARADLALGDMSAAREHYRALITNRKTALAALAGLYRAGAAAGAAGRGADLRARRRRCWRPTPNGPMPQCSRI